MSYSHEWDMQQQKQYLAPPPGALENGSKVQISLNFNNKVNFMQITGAHSKYFQDLLQTHVQTALESPDLNTDFRSIDNGLKQPCA